MRRIPVETILDLSGQVTLVTGASRGLGKAIAEVFAEAGAKVALVARDAERLEEVAKRLQMTGAECLNLPADVGEESQVAEVVEQVQKQWGRIDTLVNNAGLISPGPVDEIDPPLWHRILQANLTGAYLCVRAVCPLMQKQQHGRIINVSSVSAQTGGVSGGGITRHQREACYP